MQHVRTSLASAVALAALLGTPSVESAPPRGTIVVDLTGFGNDEGWAMVALFDDPAAFPKKPEQAHKLARSAIQGKHARIELKDVPHGRYAISAFHDENSNGKLDTNWLGIPSERVGSSNGAKGKMGPPSFDDAAFDLRSSSVTQNIRLESVF